MRGRHRDPDDHAALADHIASTGVAPRVAQAFRDIDRKFFVPEGTVQAYVDRPIAILEHQTTSQPSLIAQMIDAADVLPGDRVLEVGTGLGFQTALLARIADRVVSIERFLSISSAARINLDRAGIDNVTLVVGDGWEGVADEAPYQAIIVSAAATRVPEALVDQLDEGGRLVIPVSSGRTDDVWLYVRKQGYLSRARLLTPARFVPLVRGSPGRSKDVGQSNE